MILLNKIAIFSPLSAILARDSQIDFKFKIDEKKKYKIPATRPIPEAHRCTEMKGVVANLVGCLLKPIYIYMNIRILYA